jgi:hypothetical protein
VRKSTTHPIATYLHIICIVGSSLAAGCRPDANAAPVPVVDLLREFERADKAPPHGFSLVVHEAGGVARAAVAVPVPSRLTVPLPIPRRAVLRTLVAIDAADPAAVVRFRIGISDHRIYEGLNELVVTGSRGWADLRTDLTAYAGFQWSVFYRPDRITWRLVLATDATGGAAARGVWGAPEIVTDGASAREYVVRRERLRH